MRQIWRQFAGWLAVALAVGGLAAAFAVGSSRAAGESPPVEAMSQAGQAPQVEGVSQMGRTPSGAPGSQVDGWELADGETIFADGQFVNGPNAAGFEVAAYLEALDSPLQPYASLVQDKAAYYSLNPRLLLAILEWRGGWVTGAGQAPSSPTRDPLGYPELVGFEPELEQLAKALYEAFYSRLYAPAAARTLALPLTLPDGTDVQISGELNAASYAVQVALAPLVGAAEWPALRSAQHPAGLTQAYRRLFGPEAPLGASDPLDDSNSLMPEALPPADLLKLPFSYGDRWRFSGGPHEYDGTCDGSAVVSSVDYAPGVPYCTIPPDRWVTATAAGTVSQVACGACQVEIDHGGGWITRYYHLTDTLVTQGQAVAQDQQIGHPSCKPEVGGSCGGCTGWASGTHVHMAIKYNGAYIGIDGVSLEGWVVRDENRYQCYTDGYMQKGTSIVRVGQWITSTVSGADIFAPVTLSALAGTAGENGWYRSSVQVTLSASDSGSSGLAFTRYKLDGGAWQDYSAPFAVSSEGWHSLAYYSQDNAGNPEPENWLAIPIDTQAPGGTLLLNYGASRAYSALVRWRALVNDFSGGYTALRIRDEGTSSWSVRSGRWWDGWWLLPGSTGAVQRLEIQYRDDAGNISSSYFTPLVVDINPGQPLSANFRLPRSAYAAGGGALGSANFILNGSAGPAAPPGQLSSAGYRLGAGFWQPVGAVTYYFYLPRLTR